MIFASLIVEAGISQFFIDPGGFFIYEHGMEGFEFDAVKCFLSPANVKLVTLIRNLNVPPNIQGEFIHLDMKLKCFTERPGIN